jgi:CHAT domain-containing protein
MFSYYYLSPLATIIAKRLSEDMRILRIYFQRITGFFFSFLRFCARQIAKLLPSKLLINEQFTQEKLSQEMGTGEFSVVHIATHGNFSSDPEQTYLLAYKQLIKARDLNNLLRNNQVNSNTLKLLVLSACKTAEGDHRAVLGLAGLAVRAGASSTLSTLWQVNDDSVSQVMVQFYTEFNKNGVTKAEALHRAQKALMAQPEYQNPYYWASYILVGNWL